MKLRTVGMLTTLSILWTADFALAGTQIGILKRDTKAAAGMCVATVGTVAAANQILSRNGITVEGATSAQKIAVARAVQQMEKLAGGSFRPVRGAKIQILKEGGCGDQGRTRAGWITFRQGCGSLESVGYYAHELGHLVGNSGFYAGYKSTVPARERCAFSRYSMKDYTKARARNEEFAEAFGAFVTHPELLLQGNSGCRKAYQYFDSKVFPGGAKAACNGRSTETRVAATDEQPVARDRARPERPADLAPPDRKKRRTVARHTASDCQPGALPKTNNLRAISDFNNRLNDFGSPN